METTMLGKGVYSFFEAGRLTGVSTNRLRSWFRGRGSDRSPVMESDYDPVDGRYAISFLDLIDANVAASLRASGLSMQKIRKIYQAMKEILEEDHPFAREKIRVEPGNKTIWIEAASTAGVTGYLDVLKRQHGIPKVIQPFLSDLVYDAKTGVATEWCIARGVTVHPEYGFGKPTTRHSRRSTRVLAAAYQGNPRKSREIAAWYDVSLKEVRDAVRFERRMAA